MTLHRLAVAIGALAVVGAGIAGYLTWVHFTGTDAYCVGAGGDCERVQTSRYADLAGAPVAVLGLGGYTAILVSLAVHGSAGRRLTAFLAFVGVAFSAYLTYVELAIIDAICQWCVASAAVMTTVAVASVARVVVGETLTHP